MVFLAVLGERGEKHVWSLSIQGMEVLRVAENHSEKAKNHSEGTKFPLNNDK